MTKTTEFVKNTAPSRRHALALVAAGLGIVLVAMIESWRDASALAVGSLSILALLTLAMGSSGFLPRRMWDYGIAVDDVGFLYQRQWHKPRYIRYSSIRSIVAISFIDGGGQLGGHLRIKAKDGNAMLQEDLLYETDIMTKLMALPSFDRVAWAHSDISEDAFWAGLIPKKTQVYKADALE